LKINFLPSKEKTYTETTVKILEQYYSISLKREREQKERSQQLVAELTKQLNKKNNEIENLKIYVTLLTRSLEALSMGIIKITELEKAHNG
jgi:hypothetical protein